MPEITIETALKIWDNSQSERADMLERDNYYEGIQKILEAQEPYADGTKKAGIVTNWSAYVVNRFLGGIGPFQVTARTQKDGVDADAIAATMEELTALWERQNIAALNDELLLDCLVEGYGVELHSFDADSKQIEMTRYPPREWVFVYDSTGTLVAAIRNVVLGVGTMHDGALLEKSVRIVSVYDDKTIATYTNTDDAKEWVTLPPQQHFYRQIPVIQWSCGGSVLSEALMRQNDAYNSTDSMSIDAIYREIDSILTVIGLDANWMKDNAQGVKDSRVLPLEENGKAELLIRTADGQRFIDSITRTRSQIHIMGEVPDVDRVVGATGATSGIALKLMFLPMDQRVEAMIPILQMGVRGRIDLINAMRRKQGLATLEDYDVTIRFRMPVNRIEEWQNIKELDGIVSRSTQLTLLTDIDDAQVELSNLEEEGAVRGEPDDAAATIADRTATSDAKSVNLEATIEEVVTALSDAITTRFLKDGVV